MKIEALLVGVEEYSNQEYNLYGCKNDIDLIKSVLSARYENIRYRTLLNQLATRDNIINTILELSKSMRGGETFLFYFSGHGSHEKISPKYKAIEDDLLNETLVCYDSRGDNGVGDLTDKEISYLLSKFHKDIEVVVIYDSCHSGGGTRVIEEDEIEYIRTIDGRDGIRDFDVWLLLMSLMVFLHTFYLKHCKRL